MNTLHPFKPKRSPARRLTGAALVLAGLLASGTRAEEVSYPCLGRDYSHSLLTNAFAKAVTRYYVDPISYACIPINQNQASILQGQVERLAGNRLWIKTDVGQRVAIIGYRGALPLASQVVVRVVLPYQPSTVSARNKHREVVSIRQYRDVTMTLNEFVHFLRQGVHFPDMPELQTVAGRKGLFSTRRTARNKVAEFLQNTGQTTPPLPPPSIPAYGSASEE